MKARRVTRAEIEEVRSQGRRYRQNDGALVYLVETEPDRYMYVVENTQHQRIVTVSDRQVRLRGIERLSLRYGWRREDE